MKAAICDDNSKLLNELDAGLRRLGADAIQTTLFRSGEEIVGAYKTGKAHFDVIFLDIEMEGMDGIEAANKIRETDKHVLIVFVTSHTKYMKRSFECQPFRFLVKPVEEKEFSDVVDKIHQRLDEEKKTFIFTEDRATVRLFCEEIVYFESRSHWIWLHTKDSAYKICMSMVELCKKLDLSIFCRVHQSYMVNLSCVWRIKGNEMILYNCEKPIPISRSYRKETLTAFTNFQERKYVV